MTSVMITFCGRFVSYDSCCRAAEVHCMRCTRVQWVHTGRAASSRGFADFFASLATIRRTAEKVDAWPVVTLSSANRFDDGRTVVRYHYTTVSRVYRVTVGFVLPSMAAAETDVVTSRTRNTRVRSLYTVVVEHTSHEFANVFRKSEK